MLIEKEDTGSTNDDVRALALAGALHGTAVLARQQRAGRGRAGRAFASPEGGLYLSVLLRPESPVARWGLVPLAAGVAVARALHAEGLDARVKWPNDLLLEGAKVGGILAESVLDARPFIVVGIGLNLHAPPAGVAGATALAAHGRVPDERALARAIVADVLQETARVDRAPAELLASLRALCVTLGKEVEWENEKGVAVDVDVDGALLVEREGRRVRVVAGDVRVRQR